MNGARRDVVQVSNSRIRFDFEDKYITRFCLVRVFFIIEGQLIRLLKWGG